LADFDDERDLALGLQEDDERDNERENTGRKKKVKIKTIF
jgi:hypothetical protein